MRINSVEISNVLCFDSVCIAFDTFNLVIGPNGTGKSTIIDSIPLALFKKSYRTNKLSSLIKSNDHQSSIKLEFEHIGDVYEISRYFSKKGQDFITKNGKTIGTGATACNSVMNDIIPHDVFLHLIGMQRKLTDIIDNSTIKSIVQKAYNIEKVQLFNKAIDRIVRTLNSELNVRLDLLYELKSGIDDKEIQNLEAQYKSKKNDINTLALKIEQLNEQIRQTDLTIQKLKQKIQEIETKLSKLSSINEDLITAYDFIQNLDVNQYKQRIHILVNMLLRHDIHTILKLFKIDIRRLETKIKKLSTLSHAVYEFKQYTRSNAGTYNILSKIYKLYHNFPLNMLIIDVSNVNKDYIINVAKDCVVYIGSRLQRKPYQPRYTIRDYEYMLHNLDQIDTQSSLNLQISESQKRVLSKFKTWDEVQKWLRTFEENTKNMVKTLSFVGTKVKQKELELLSGIYEKARQLQQHFDSEDDIQLTYKLIQYMRLIKQNFSSLNDFLEQMKFYRTQDVERLKTELNTLKKEYDNETNNYERLVSNKSKLLDNMNKLKDEYLRIKYRLKTLNEKIKELKRLETDIDEINRQLELTKSYKNVLETYSQHITNMIQIELPKQLLETMHYFGFNSFSNIVLDSSYNLFIEIDDNLISYKLLSAAQQSILALGLIFSLCTIFNIKIPLILDEPTEGFDNERIETFKIALEKSNNLFTQVIIATHDSRLIIDECNVINTEELYSENLCNV